MKIKTLFSWACFIFGLALLFSVVLPPLYWWYFSWLIRPTSLFDPEAVSLYPIPKLINSQGLYQDIALDNPDVWFPTATSSAPLSSPVNSFLISFPNLKIKNIEVTVNGTDLKYHPIHYPGTALPGSIGNTVILGHSALPQFYFFGNNWTVFNPLLKLKLGDSVKIDYAGQNLTYQISKIFEVNPSQVEVLNQPDNKRELTLITCVPLGTYLRRLVLVGDLIN